MSQQLVDAETRQDALRSVRSFVGTLSGIVNDQSWDRLDGTAYSQPYQYQSIGSTGVAVEGSTVATTSTQGGGITLSKDVMVLIFVGVAAYVLTH